MPRSLWLCLLWLFACCGLAPLSTTAQSADNAAAGGETFNTTCAACHGLDGRGSERGPDISRSAKVQRMSDFELLRLVLEGLPGTGMPSFRSLGMPQIEGVVRHLRTLQGQEALAHLPGDPDRGKTLFFGRPGCSRCHMANGEGGFLGPDLSAYSRTAAIDDIRRAVTSPNENLDPRQRTVVVTAADGRQFSGIARNEDNFSLQLETADGAFRSFLRSAVRKVEHQPRSLMPADYRSTLTPQELDDLVSFLMSIGRTKTSQRTHLGPTRYCP